MGGTHGKMRGRKDVPPNNYFPKDQSDLKMIEVKNFCGGNFVVKIKKLSTWSTQIPSSLPFLTL